MSTDRWIEAATAIHVVSSFQELHAALMSMSTGLEGIGRVFRGQGDSSWSLVPKAGRSEYAAEHFPIYFRDWKLQALEFLRDRPRDDWEWLAIAQHHGLATNFLDWSYNPLAAAFFAVSESHQADAVVFAYEPNRLVMPSVARPLSRPLGESGVSVFKPYHLSSRIRSQMGMFTVHNPPTTALEDSLSSSEALDVILIKEEYRPRLLCDLAAYGVNYSSLFPDLEGLAREFNWKIEKSACRDVLAGGKEGFFRA